MSSRQLWFSCGLSGDLLNASFPTALHSPGEISHYRRSEGVTHRRSCSGGSAHDSLANSILPAWRRRARRCRCCDRLALLWRAAGLRGRGRSHERNQFTPGIDDAIEPADEGHHDADFGFLLRKMIRPATKGAKTPTDWSPGNSFLASRKESATGSDVGTPTRRLG